MRATNVSHQRNAPNSNKYIDKFGYFSNPLSKKYISTIFMGCVDCLILTKLFQFLLCSL